MEAGQAFKSPSKSQSENSPEKIESEKVREAESGELK